MAMRKIPPTTHQGQHSSTTRRISALIGVALVGLALLLFVWLYVRQASPTLRLFQAPPAPPNTANAPLNAVGITLSAPAQGQEPQLTRQQALALVNQMEPGIAAQAGSVNAQYTLFSYTSTANSQLVYQNRPVWLIHYTQVNEPRPDTQADSHASRVQHDFYVFLDAASGQELLAIWL